MSSFTEADFRSLGQYREGRELFEIVDGLEYDIGYLGSGLSVKVPAGFVTDGPSVPDWLKRVVPVSKMVKSAAVHDMLREDLRFCKTDGDAIFLTAMCAEGTPTWLKWLAFLAVCLNNSRKRAH